MPDSFVDSLPPPGESPIARKEEEEEKDSGRPPAPVSPAPPPPSAGAGGLTNDIKDLPEPPEEDQDPGTRKPSIDDYTRRTFSDIGITLPSHIEKDLGKNYKVPFTVVEKDYLSKALPKALGGADDYYVGKEAIAMAEMRNDLLVARMKNFIIQYKEANQKDPSKDEYIEAFKKEAQRAHDDLYDLAITSMGKRRSSVSPLPNRIVWLDTDVGGKLYGSIATPFGTLELSKPGEERGAISRLLSPFAMMGAGVEQRIVAEELDSEGNPTGGYVLPVYNESHAMGYMDYFSRMGVSTPVITALKAGGAEDPFGPFAIPQLIKGYGSDEHLRLMRGGEDVMTLSDDLNLGRALYQVYPMLKPLYKADEAGLLNTGFKSLSDAAVGFAIALVDIDAFSALTAGLGKVAKTRAVLRVADKFGTSAVAKFTGLADDAQKAAETITQYFIDGEKPLEFLGPALSKLPPKMKQQVIHATMQVMATSPKLSKVSEEIIEGLAQSKGGRLTGSIPEKALKTDPKTDARAVAKEGAWTQRRTSKQLKDIETEAKALEGAGETAKARTLRYQADQYRRAQLRDISLATMMADLFAHKKAIKALKGIAKVSSKTPKMAPDKAYAKMKEIMSRVYTARQDMNAALARTPKPVRGQEPADLLAAERRLEKANRDFFNLTTDLAETSTLSAEKLLDELILTTSKALKDSDARMTKWRDKINKMGIQGLKVTPKNHNKIRKAILENAPRQMEPTLVVGAVTTVLREMSEQYANLAKFTREARPGGIVNPRMKALEAYKKQPDAPGTSMTRADEVYLAEQLEILVKWTGFAEKVGVDRHLNNLRRTVNSYLGPLYDKLGAMSPEMREIGVSAIAYERRSKLDMVNHVEPAAREAGKTIERQAKARGITDKAAIATAKNKAEAKVFNDYIDSSDTVNGSILNTTFAGRTPWQMAQKIIRASMYGETDQERLFFQALTRMYLPNFFESTIEMAEITKQAQALLRFGGYGRRELKMLKKTKTAADIKKLSPKELNEYYALRNRGQSITWEKFNKGMFEITKKVAGGADRDFRRVAVRAAMVINNAAILNRSATRMTQEVAGWSPELAEKAARLMQGELTDMSGTYSEVVTFLNRLKMPAAVKRYKNEADRYISNGLKVYADPDNPNHLILPVEFMNNASVSIARLNKELQRVHASSPPFLRALYEVPLGFYRLWQTAILTGLFVPRTAYWANIYFGNMGQLIGEGEFYLASKYALSPVREAAFATKRATERTASFAYRKFSATTLAQKTPLGQYVDLSIDYMGRKLKTDNVLSSSFNALLNTDLQKIMDPRYAKATDYIPGTGITYGQMRRMAIEERVFSSFAGTSKLANIIERYARIEAERKGVTNLLIDGEYWQAAKKTQARLMTPKSIYADWADFIEQRQRLALFVDLIVNKGVDPKEAGKRIRTALYDWDTPLGHIEGRVLGNVFLFYSFHKKSLGQGFRILTEPFVKGIDDSAADIVLKSSPVLAAATGRNGYKMAYLSAMNKFIGGMKESTLEKGQVQPDGSVEGGTSAVYPGWSTNASNKIFLSNSPMSKERSVSYTQSLGKAKESDPDITHSVLTMPSVTPIESVRTITNIIDGMAKMAIGLSKLVGEMSIYNPIVDSEGATSDFTSGGGQVLSEIAKLANPAGEVVLEGVLEDFGMAKPRQEYLRAGQRVTRPSDKFVLQLVDAALPLFGGEAGGLIWKNRLAEGDEWRTNPTTLKVYRAIPGLASDINNYLGPALAVSAEGGDISEAIYETGLALMNIKKYRYSPEKELKYDLKETKEQMDVLRKIEQQKGGFEKQRKKRRGRRKRRRD